MEETRLALQQHLTFTRKHHEIQTYKYSITNAMCDGDLGCSVSVKRDVRDF